MGEKGRQKRREEKRREEKRREEKRREWKRREEKRGEEKRTKKGSEFIITGGNSDLQVNIVLKAKLEKDFGIILKDFEDEETPEKYFESIKQSINRRDRWDVKKFITLGYFYFPKMAMYYDLDPQNWQDLGSQQSLQDIFSGSDQDSDVPELGWGISRRDNFYLMGQQEIQFY